MLTRRVRRGPRERRSFASHCPQGGNPPVPGEISLSHNGVLFLDEFNRRTLEVLRQPLEDGTVTISRAMNATTFPATFLLVGALNPCPCGYRNDPRRECHCTVPQSERYKTLRSRPSTCFRRLTGCLTGQKCSRHRNRART